MVNYNNLLTNGAAMKIFPIGLLNGRDLDKTILDVITVSKQTHFTNLALSGACAVACAVGEAMSNEATLETVNQAGLYGARMGNQQALKLTGKISAGPSIEKRMELAIELSQKTSDFDEVLILMSDLIGTGVWVTESVPCVFGLINAFPDAMTAIYAGVNIGSDTDTIATMAGAILGALQGTGALDRKLVEQALKVNALKIGEYAERFIHLL